MSLHRHAVLRRHKNGWLSPIFNVPALYHLPCQFSALPISYHFLSCTMVAGPVAVLSENAFASGRVRRRRFEVTCGGGDGGGGGCGGGGRRSGCNGLWPLVVESLWLQDTPAVLSSVVVCGRLTLLSYSKIFLLHHDPPLHTDWPTPAMVFNLPGLRGGTAKPCSKPKPSCSYLDPRVHFRRPLELAAP